MSSSAVGDFDADGRCSCCVKENGFRAANCKPGHLICEHCGLTDSSSLPGFSCFPPSLSVKLWRIILASTKGFAIGAGLKGGLSLFSISAKALSSLRRNRGIRNQDSISAALKETLRYGLFLGTFAGTFVSIDEIIASLAGHRSARWRALLAGAVAGPSMLLTGTQHKSLAIYIFMRASILASRCGIKSKRFGQICKPLTWSHGDVFLMCLASCQIL